MLFLPQEVDEMLTEGLQEPYLRSKKAFVRPENVNWKLEIAGPENLDLRSERPGLRPERLDLRPERPDLRPKGSDKGGGLTDGRTDGRTDERTDERKSPCVLQDFIPFGAAAQKVTLSNFHTLQVVRLKILEQWR